MKQLPIPTQIFLPFIVLPGWVYPRSKNTRQKMPQGILNKEHCVVKGGKTLRAQRPCDRYALFQLCR
jgi:hypothetical protein